MGTFNRANLKKTLYYLKRNGLKNTWYAVRERMEERQKEKYCYHPITQETWEEQRKASEMFTTTFSIVVPAYRTDAQYLKEMITSVIKQSYPRWELIIADATEDDSVAKVVEEVARGYSCIRYVHLQENAGIAANTNQGLRLATGEYVGLLDHDDVLTEDALYEMAAVIEKEKERGVQVKLLYSDEDKCNSDGTQYYEPNFKEKFNLDLILSNNYICHFLVMEAELMKALEFRQEYNGAQDYDLVLRAVAKLMNDESQLVHIPKVLYHWRCHAASTAENPRSKQYAYDAGLRALQDFADQMEWKAKAVPLKHLGFYALQYEENPLKVRPDVGAVGGRLVSGNGNRTVGGRMTETGEVYYEGLPTAYSGYLHRASLTQTAEALDIRCMKISEELQLLFKEVTGISYKEMLNYDLFDASILPQESDYVELSLRLSKAIREKGYLLLYLPNRTEEWDSKKGCIKMRGRKKADELGSVNYWDSFAE